MSFRNLFSSINCQRIIFFEDDFIQAPFNKAKMFYDLARMDVDDRDAFLTEVNMQSSNLNGKIRAFLDLLDQYFDKIGTWRDLVVDGDIETVFPLIGAQNPDHQSKIKLLYEEINDEEVAPVYSIGAKFGIGVSPPAQYISVFDDYVFSDNRSKSFRIYTDYLAHTAELFLTDIGGLANTNCIVCIIDNHLGDTKRASEIIGDIKKDSPHERKNIVGCVFSSQESYEEIDLDVYFEYASKENISNLEACLAKSAYNYYLYKLKGETLNRLNNAFELAQKSKGIAYYLSQKALIEGESEYQIINDWIRLLSTDSQTDSENMKHLIALSRVINSLEENTDCLDESLQKLNYMEVFDYNVNKYYLPITAGDIFTDDKGNWYVLIGQDCDMARSISRSPRNALAELLPARVRPQTDFKKWANDLENVSIYSFRESFFQNSKILQIDYQKRKYIANEIINLCSYNEEGQCRISIEEDLNDEQRKLMPQYMIDYYHTLKKYYTVIKSIKVQVKEAFDVINNTEQTHGTSCPLLIPINDFSGDDPIIFNLRRVCRLSHSYVFYLYKLYLEHRGRQPFQTINLVQSREVSLPVFNNNEKTEYLCTVRQIENPNMVNPKNWCWIITHTEITRISELLSLGNPIYEHDETYIKEDKLEIPLIENTKKLIIQKEKDKIRFYST